MVHAGKITQFFKSVSSVKFVILAMVCAMALVALSACSGGSGGSGGSSFESKERTVKIGDSEYDATYVKPNVDIELDKRMSSMIGCYDEEYYNPVKFADEPDELASNEDEDDEYYDYDTGLRIVGSYMPYTDSDNIPDWVLVDVVSMDGGESIVALATPGKRYELDTPASSGTFLLKVKDWSEALKSTLDVCTVDAQDDSSSYDEEYDDSYYDDEYSYDDPNYDGY